MCHPGVKISNQLQDNIRTKEREPTDTIASAVIARPVAKIDWTALYRSPAASGGSFPMVRRLLNGPSNAFIAAIASGMAQPPIERLLLPAEAVAGQLCCAWFCIHARVSRKVQYKYQSIDRPRRSTDLHLGKSQ